MQELEILQPTDPRFYSYTDPVNYPIFNYPSSLNIKASELTSWPSEAEGIYELVKFPNTNTARDLSFPVYKREGAAEEDSWLFCGYLGYLILYNSNKAYSSNWNYTQLGLPWNNKNSGITPSFVEPPRIKEDQKIFLEADTYIEKFIQIADPVTFGNRWTLSSEQQSLKDLKIDKEGRLYGSCKAQGVFKVTVELTNPLGATSVDLDILVKSLNGTILKNQIINLRENAENFEKVKALGSIQSLELLSSYSLPEGLTLDSTKLEIQGSPQKINTLKNLKSRENSTVFNFLKYPEECYNTGIFTSSEYEIRAEDSERSTSLHRSEDLALELVSGTLKVQKDTKARSRTYILWLNTRRDMTVLGNISSNKNRLRLIEISKNRLIFRLPHHLRTSGVLSSVDDIYGEVPFAGASDWNCIAYVLDYDNQKVAGYLNGIRVVELELNKASKIKVARAWEITDLNKYGEPFEILLGRKYTDCSYLETADS